MRPVLLVVGVVMLLLGGICLLVPLFPQAIDNVDGGGDHLSPETPAAFALDAYGVPYRWTFTWSATFPTRFTVLTCSSFDTTTLQCHGPTVLGNESGTGGTLSVWVPSGATLELTATGIAEVTVSATATGPLVGLILIVPGTALTLVGGLARRKGPAAAPVPP